MPMRMTMLVVMNVFLRMPMLLLSTAIVVICMPMSMLMRTRMLTLMLMVALVVVLVVALFLGFLARSGGGGHHRLVDILGQGCRKRNEIHR